MGTLTGRRVRWGQETGVVVSDPGREHVWVERDDGQDCFAHRDLVEVPDVAVAALVEWQWHVGKGVVLAKFTRSDGTRMAVLEYDQGLTFNAPIDELETA